MRGPADLDDSLKNNKKLSFGNLPLGNFLYICTVKTET